MGPMQLYFDVRDIFRAPRLALSGKKIWIFMIANLVGYVAYWILTYIAFALTGSSPVETWQAYGLFPCLFGTGASGYAWIPYWVGVLVWFYALNLGCTAVARVAYKQLKGDEFYSSGDAWKFVKKHWHPVIFTWISFFLILLFFIVMAGIFALLGKIPYLGEFFFSLPYLLYFFGSVFTVYTAVVFLVSLLYTPAIIAAYEEDTMGAVFQSYSITWGQPWRIVLYHSVLVPAGALAAVVFYYFWIGGYKLINLIFGQSFLMGTKLSTIIDGATALVCPAIFSRGPLAVSPIATESIAIALVAIFLFLLLVVMVSYPLSILSVGETLMFVIFKKRSDDDNLLERKDEEELETEEEVPEEEPTASEAEAEEPGAESPASEADEEAQGPAAGEDAARKPEPDTESPPE